MDTAALRVQARARAIVRELGKGGTARKRWGVAGFDDCDEQWKLIRCTVGLSISLAGRVLRPGSWGTLHEASGHVTR